MGPGHQIIVSKPQNVYSTSCQEHDQQTITLACSICRQLFCTSCETEGTCIGNIAIIVALYIQWIHGMFYFHLRAGGKMTVTVQVVA